MKETKGLFEAVRSIAIIATIVIIALSMIACDTGDGNGTGTGNSDNGNYLIKGQFANLEAGVNATFYANTASSRAAGNFVGRSAAASEALTGKIEDGQIIFNLTGVYFPENGSFILSAGSSFLVYEIAGTVTNTGLSETQATVKINNNTTGGDWTTFQINVTTANDVSITGAASNQQSNGLPSSWLGNWNYRTYSHEYYGGDCEICGGECEGHQTGEYQDNVMIIAQFGVYYIEKNDGKTYLYFDIVEVARVTNTEYDMIALIPGGSASGSCSDCFEMDSCPPDCAACGNNCECNEENIISTFGYIKLRLEQPTANRLKFGMYMESLKWIDEEGALAFVRAFNTSGAALEDDIMEFTR